MIMPPGNGPDCHDPPDWRRYQSRVARVFAALGLDANVEERVRGARAEHVIDIVVRSRRSGVDQLWLVECKHWARPVSKNVVLTFRGVMEDVGADRGFLVSENGFQLAAELAARFSPVTLSSLPSLMAQTEDDALHFRLDQLCTLLDVVQARMYDLPPAAFQDHDWIRSSDVLRTIDEAVGDARRGHFPLRRIVPETVAGLLDEASDLRSFLREAERAVRKVERWRDDLGESPHELIQRLVHDFGFQHQFRHRLSESLAASRNDIRDPRPDGWAFDRIAEMREPEMTSLYHPAGIGLTTFSVACRIVTASTTPGGSRFLIGVDAKIGLTSHKIHRFRLRSLTASLD